MSNRIGIIDFGAGNLLSVKRAFEKFDAEVEVLSSVLGFNKIDKLILPGVGAFPNAMKELSKAGFIPQIIQAARMEIPIFAICLGMQLLMDGSDEISSTDGLGLIKGRVTKISSSPTFNLNAKIPHVGWNSLIFSKEEELIRQSILRDSGVKESFYFVHSYMVQPINDLAALASTSYGGVSIPAVIQENSVVGCQFHPEKSGPSGLKLIENFVKL